MPISYQAQYTESFSDFCQRHSADDAQLFGVLSAMPADLNQVTFETRFKQRNWHKEIGSETEELFIMQMAVKFDEVINRYKWKIEKFHTKISTMLDRYDSVNITDTDTNSGTDSSNLEAKQYLNPINGGNTGYLTDKRIDDNSFTHGKVVTMSRTKILQYAFNDNNATLIKAINDLDSIYEEALEYLDRLFMVIL